MSTPAAVRVWESRWSLYRQIWRSNLLGSFVQPLIYLLGMGIGVGSLVDHGTASAHRVIGGVPYFAFFAPALIATTAMFVTAGESLWPVMDGFHWSHAFQSMSATPLRPTDVVNGVTLWHATRAGIAAIGVAVVLACFHDTRSWGLIPAVPSAVLTGLAFSTPFSAWSSTRNTTGDASFPAIMRFVITPMFLFAGAFYPISQLPEWLHPIAYATPLWNGVELCRGFVLHSIGFAAAIGHVAVLCAYAGAGWLMCRSTFTKQLGK